jgi:very-short-patch-repair endonuclease
MPTDPASAICRRQHGVISRRQALAAGLTPRQVERRLTSQRWRALLPGVYISSEVKPSWDAWAHAALLAAGTDSALVADSAAAARVLIPKVLPINVAIPAHRRSALRNPRIHVIRLDVPQDDRVVIDGLATTTQLRTAVDLAHLLPPTDAQSIIDRMLVREQIALDDLTAAVAASRRHGSAQARALIRSANDLAAAESERYARRLLVADGITGWVGNHVVPVGDHKVKVDLALKHLRIAVEVKGWMFHSAGDRGASDDSRVTDLQLAGWLVIPVSWLTMHKDPETSLEQARTAVRIRTALFAA